MRAHELAAELAGRGFIAAGAESMPLAATPRPWFVSAVLGTAGWLASLFVFLFVLVFFDPDTASGFAVAGLVMLGAGLGLYAAGRDSAFLEQLALALTLAGEIGLIVAVGQATESASVTALFATLLCGALVRIVPSAFARALSAAFACVAWALAVRFLFWGDDWFTDPERSVGLIPAVLGWFVIWAPAVLGVRALVAREVHWMASPMRRIARPALTGLLVALSIGGWASQPFAALTFWTPTVAVPVNWLVIWPLLGVGTALFAALNAFRLRHRPLLGFAIAGALLHVVQFYYLLGVSLVVKSWIMIAVGVGLFLAARRLAHGEAIASAPAPAAGGVTP